MNRPFAIASSFNYSYYSSDAPFSASSPPNWDHSHHEFLPPLPPSFRSCHALVSRCYRFKKPRWLFQDPPDIFIVIVSIITSNLSFLVSTFYFYFSISFFLYISVFSSSFSIPSINMLSFLRRMLIFSYIFSHFIYFSFTLEHSHPFSSPIWNFSLVSCCSLKLQNFEFPSLAYNICIRTC